MHISLIPSILNIFIDLQSHINPRFTLALGATHVLAEASENLWYFVGENKTQYYVDLGEVKGPFDVSAQKANKIGIQRQQTYCTVTGTCNNGHANFNITTNEYIPKNTGGVSKWVDNLCGEDGTIQEVTGECNLLESLNLTNLPAVGDIIGAIEESSS